MVIQRGYETTLPASSQFPLTVPIFWKLARNGQNSFQFQITFEGARQNGMGQFMHSPDRTKNKTGVSEMYGFVAVVFDGKKTAQKALSTLEDYAPGYVWVDDVAVLSRGKLGATHIHSTWAQDDSDITVGGGWGLITGGLIGLLFGPGGAMAGAAIGGSLGAMGGAADEITFDDPRLDDLTEALCKDSSALILVGEKPTLGDFTSAVEPLGGKVIQSALTEDDIRALRKELKAAA